MTREGPLSRVERGPSRVGQRLDAAGDGTWPPCRPVDGRVIDQSAVACISRSPVTR